MFCSNCGKEIDDKAVVCIYCGCSTNNKVPRNKISGCLIGCGSIIVAFFILAAIGASVGNTDNMLQSIEDKVAQDAVQQYQIAKKQGDKIQVCVQAGLVSAAYLQAKNETEYNKWKTIEKQECVQSGMPQF